MCPSEMITHFKDGLIGFIQPENIIEDPDILESFSRDHDQSSGVPPLLLIYPRTGEDLRKIVKVANTTHTPIVPVSSGPPRFHGDTVPERGGAIVDFSRMNRILKIDAKSRYTMVEPGVTYTQLIPALKKHDMRINMPLLPRASKSVVTSCLEREPRLIPKYQYDYVDPLLTLEVVYGTGHDLRTGSASGPGSLDTLKADKVNPWGPGSVDFFRFVSGAQGTMGLVNWAIIKTEVLPAAQELYVIPVEKPETFIALINLILRKRIVDECLVLNRIILATILAEEGLGDFSELKKGLPQWTIITCVAGYTRRPEGRVSLQKKQLNAACSELGLVPQSTLPGAVEKEDKVLDLLSSAWQRVPYWKLLSKSACCDIFFLSPLSRVPVFIQLMEETVSEHGYPIKDMGCYVQPMVQGRGCHCEFLLPYESADRSETARMDNLFLQASARLIEQGAFFSRPYGPWAKMVYDRDPKGVAALKKLKDIFDPNHILNPGKLCFQN